MRLFKAPVALATLAMAFVSGASAAPVIELTIEASFQSFLFENGEYRGDRGSAVTQSISLSFPLANPQIFSGPTEYFMYVGSPQTGGLSIKAGSLGSLLAARSHDLLGNLGLTITGINNQFGSVGLGKRIAENHPLPYPHLTSFSATQADIRNTSITNAYFSTQYTINGYRIDAGGSLDPFDIDEIPTLIQRIGDNDSGLGYFKPFMIELSSRLDVYDGGFFSSNPFSFGFQGLGNITSLKVDSIELIGGQKVPEPGSIALLMLGLIGCSLVVHRSKTLLRNRSVPARELAS